eukprot:GFUD01017952.1.p1 GENE.GFUD01017952.1~~GFUD01017952.1.p1  ORF type:complete len:777 (-),score=171.72 GFUD01017952.1:113-2443(-)
MPCTLPRREVWLVSPLNCPSCCKLPLPRSVKQQLHKACNSQAVATLWSHKICRLRSKRVTRESSLYVKPKNVLRKSKTCWSVIDRKRSSTSSSGNTGSEVKKVRMEEGLDRGDSDTDSDSVIILTDDDDDKPIRQRLIESREVFAREASNTSDDAASLLKHEVQNDGSFEFDVKLESKVFENPFEEREVKHTTCAMGVEVDGKSLKRSSKVQVKLENKEVFDNPTEVREVTTCATGGEVDGKPLKWSSKVPVKYEKQEVKESTSSAEEEEFEKHCKQDRNFVLAKFMVKKKVGFDCDYIPNPGPFEKKMMKIMEQADIMKLKKSLDDGGGTAFTPKDVKKLLPKPALATPLPTTVPTISKLNPMTLSEEDSPNTTQTIPFEHKNVTQMPVVFGDAVNDPSSGNLPEKIEKNANPFKFYPYCPPHPKNKKLSGPKRVPILKPAVVFPSFKTKSFKIPRAAKTKPPRWVTNGALWQWALTVDDAGQYSRTDKERKKVPWAALVTARMCEEFEGWLSRGCFKEGDDCNWGEKKVIEERDKHEVKRRRDEMIWREKVMDKLLGGEMRTEGLISTRDPLGLEEWDSGVGISEFGQYSTGGTVAGSEATEELTENELNVSQQSLVTHIQTPTHAFGMDEAASDGTDCMDEVGGVDINENVLVSTLPVNWKDNKPTLASLPGLRGPPTQVKRAPSLRLILPSALTIPGNSLDLSNPSTALPNVAPSGFAFTKLPASTTSDEVVSRTKEGESVQSPSCEFPAGSQGSSVLSGLVAGKKARFRLF